MEDEIKEKFEKLKNEYLGKNKDLHEIKNKIKEEKENYNNSLGEYNKMMKELIEAETLIETFEKKINKLKSFKQKFILDIGNSFFNNFQHLLVTLPRDFIIHLLNVIGIKHTNLEIFQNSIESESELILLFQNCYLFNFIDNLHLNEKIEIEKILMIEALCKKSNIDEIPYPFKDIFDCVIKTKETLNEIESREQTENKIKTFQIQKNNLFIQMKRIESEIAKLETIFKNLEKFINQIQIFIENFNILLSIKDDQEKFSKCKELFKTIDIYMKSQNPLNQVKRNDHIANLTIKSEFSEDFSEFQRENKKHMQTISINKDKKNFITSPNKINDRLLSRVKTEQNPIRFKNVKQIRNKKLKNSNDNSLDYNTNSNTNTSSKVINNIKPEIKTSTTSTTKQQSKTSNRSIKLNLLMSPRHQLNNQPIKVKSTNKTPIKTITPTTISTNIAKNATTSNKKLTTKADLREKSMTRDLLFSDSEDENMRKLKNKINNSLLIKNTCPAANISLTGNLGLDQMESQTDEYIVSPLNKIPVRSSKLISEKPTRAKSVKPPKTYLNLKLDRYDVNSVGGCCVACT